MKNGKIKIERGIPVPSTNAFHHGYTATLRTLKVGESVVLPNSVNAASALIRQLKRATKKRFDGDFTARKVDGDHTRVWRIK